MKKKKNPKNPLDCLGNIERAYFGYSSDNKIRAKAASGGIVSSILIYLLGQSEIDGALVTKQVIVDGRIDYKVFIAKTPAEILSTRGSIYFDVSLLKSLSYLKRFKGRLAIVGLPCHIKEIRKQMNSDRLLAEKVRLLIGLFCTHSSKKSLLLAWLKRKKIQESDIERFIFRRGHWRGKTLVHLKNNIIREYPYMDYGTYQILYFHVCKRCLSCGDQTAEQADISCGDAWLSSFKKNPIKHSTIIARNKNGMGIIHEMIKKGIISAKETNPETIYKAHKRSLIFHKNVSARENTSKLFGVRIKSGERFKVRWNDYMAAAIVLANYKISNNKLINQILFKFPKPILKIYMYGFKFLTNF